MNEYVIEQKMLSMRFKLQVVQSRRLHGTGLEYTDLLIYSYMQNHG